MTASFLLRCQNILRYFTPEMMHFSGMEKIEFIYKTETRTYIICPSCIEGQGFLLSDVFVIHNLFPSFVRHLSTHKMLQLVFLVIFLDVDQQDF